MHLASLYSEWCPDSTIPGVFLVQNSSEHSSALENKGAVSTMWERANLPDMWSKGKFGGALRISKHSSRDLLSPQVQKYAELPIPEPLAGSAVEIL